MIRNLVLPVALAAALTACDRSSAARYGGIIPETTANRHGLTRPWLTQIQIDRGRARLSHMVLHDGTLFVQSDRAMVHAIDAETGRTLWARHIGRANHPSMAAGAGVDLLAIVNGSRLYVCNRHNGGLLFEVQIRGAPGAGPGMSEKRAYVPTVSGLVLAYRLEPPTDPVEELGITAEIARREQEPEVVEEDRRENLRLQQEYIPPLACQSLGRTLVQPLVTLQNEGEEYVTWPTDRGHLNIAQIDRRDEGRFAVKFRLEPSRGVSARGIAARPTYLPRFPNVHKEWGMIFAASRDGFVHAIQENNGESFWRFSTGEPILQPAVVIQEQVFVATQPGGMYCLDAKTGQEKWWAPQIAQFIAASKQRVYAADKMGRIQVLNVKTGARLDTIAARGLSVKLINSQTDRLYLASDTGLVQCLHELEQVGPILHGQARLKDALGEADPAADATQPGVPAPPADLPAGIAPGGGDQDPLGGDAGQADNPFEDAGGGADEDPVGGGADKDPGGGGGVDEDPFGGTGGEDPFR